MKLLVITQKVDIDDDILGFFHQWIEKLSGKFDFLNVICLQAGKYSLPQNVKVFSLGKEEGRSRTKEFFRFYRYVWRLRKNYDAVFVHMNPIYVVLGGVFWKIQGKKIYLWHNHRHGNAITRAAIWLSDVVFYTSPFSFSARFKKSKIMPAGIDTTVFSAKGGSVSDGKIRNSILYVGRFSPVKNVDILIKAAGLLEKQGVDFTMNIVGQPGDDEGENFQKIKTLAKDLEAKGKIRFLGKLTNSQLPAIYNQNDIFVNLTQTGSFDKTILEAMACQIMVLVSNPAYREIFPKDLQDIMIFKERDCDDLAQKISHLMQVPENIKQGWVMQLREIVVKDHNLDDLIGKIIYELNQK